MLSCIALAAGRLCLACRRIATSATRGKDTGTATLEPDHHACHAQHRDDQSERRNQNPTSQTGYAAGPHRKLGLHEKIADGATPGPKVTQQLSVATIEIQLGMTDAARTMTVAGAMKLNAVNAPLRGV